MHHQVATLGSVPGECEVDAQGAGGRGPVDVDVHQGDLSSWEAGEQPRDTAADHAGADDRDPVADQRRGIPQRVDGSLHRAGENRPLSRHVLGHQSNRGGWHDVGALVRVETEDRAVLEIRRTVLDDADVEVAVLHGAGEVAVLKGCPHRRVLVRRYAAAEDQGLGSTAHPAAQRAHAHVTRTWLRYGRRLDHPPTGFAHPERERVTRHSHHLLRAFGEPKTCPSRMTVVPLHTEARCVWFTPVR